MNGRRKSDRFTHRVIYALLALAIASSLLASYISYRALRAMDETSHFAADAYRLGKVLGKAPDFSPRSNEQEIQ